MSDSKGMNMRRQVILTMDDRYIIGQPGHPKEWNDGIDGGDSINRLGHYTFLLWANRKLGYDIGEEEDLPQRTGEDYERQMSMFECPESRGNYRRHPYCGWCSYCGGTYDGNMSRDQSTPAVVGMSVTNSNARLLRFFARHACRLFLFTTNTRRNGEAPPYRQANLFQAASAKLKGHASDWKVPDVTFMEFFSLYMRSLPATWALVFLAAMGMPSALLLYYALLSILDLESLVDSALWNFRKDDDDILNHATVCLYNQMTLPTPVSWLACKVLRKETVMDKLERYWCGWRGSCYFRELYELPVKTFFR